MKSTLTSHYLKNQYSEFIYLASFYRWMAFRSGNATGSRSPIDGKQYTVLTGSNHDAVYKAGQIAMSKVYFKQAAEIRKAINK